MAIKLLLLFLLLLSEVLSPKGQPIKEKNKGRSIKASPKTGRYYTVTQAVK